MIPAVITPGEWATIAVPVLGLIGGAARWLGRKLDNIGKHLDAQDQRHVGLAERVARVEASQGLKPLPIPNPEAETA